LYTALTMDNDAMKSHVTQTIAENLVNSGAASEIGQTLASNAFDAGTKQARGIIESYANIDMVKPFFNVEPVDIRNRLVGSLRPILTGDDAKKIEGDLYGPTMIVFTLAAILVMSMKAQENTQNLVGAEGTVMGKAIGISIGYWFGCSAFLYAVAFIFNTTIKSTEIMSSVGYAMFGFIVMLLADYAEKGQRDFYAAWLTVGFLSAAKLASVLRARTTDKKQGLIVAGLALAAHWFYGYHLHWSYTPPEQ